MMSLRGCGLGGCIDVCGNKVPDPCGADICRDPNESIRGEIFAPHYTDERFKEAQSVYLSPEHQMQKKYSVDNVEGAFYNYSDRLYLEYYELWNKTFEQLFKKYPKNSAIFYSKLLSVIYKRRVKVVHIISGYNRSTGYPYQAFGTIDLPRKKSVRIVDLEMILRVSRRLLMLLELASSYPNTCGNRVTFDHELFEKYGSLNYQIKDLVVGNKKLLTINFLVLEDHIDVSMLFDLGKNVSCISQVNKSYLSIVNKIVKKEV